MDTPEGYRFAIIGGGLTATSLLCQLVDKLECLARERRGLRAALRVEIFEKGPVVGPGLPHNDRYVLPFHITNMCAKDMSVRVSRLDDFQNWVTRNPGVVDSVAMDPAESYSPTQEDSQECCHYPRAVMGEYLKSQFNEAATRANALGIAVEVYTNSEVTDLFYRGDLLYLTFHENLRPREDSGPYDAVLLATGHWFEETQLSTYFGSPWPAARLQERVPAGVRVGVIGSSLSGIETALTLSADGQFRRVASGQFEYVRSRSPRQLTLLSRGGQIPRVRGRLGRRRNRYLNCDRLRKLMAESPHQVSLDTLYQLLEKELTDAYSGSTEWRQILDPQGSPKEILEQDIERARLGDGTDGELIWQTVLVQIFPVVRELYLHLKLAERQRFDHEFTTRFFSHAATQPMVNAEKLLALMRAGTVSIVRLGEHYRFEHDKQDGSFVFSYQIPGGENCQQRFDYCVNARGQPRSVETDGSMLMQNLLRRGLVQLQEAQTEGYETPFIHHTGTIIVDPLTHRVVPPDRGRSSVPAGGLYAIGAMTRGQIIDTSMAYGLARSTATIAAEMIARLS